MKKKYYICSAMLLCIKINARRTSGIDKGLTEVTKSLVELI